tara:strand:- start:1250 stop:1411 length:162 start_codon:yes stop_codon:yes gene_type:complete
MSALKPDSISFNPLALPMVRHAFLRDTFICSEIYFNKNKTTLPLHNEVDFVKR